VNPQNLRIRRATVDDRPALQDIWLSMRLPADELDSRFTEFQVIEADGQVAGAIGFQIIGTAALLHSEGYIDFAIADAARQLFWDRIQALSSNYGVFRLWTQENSPFWLRWGFQPADDELLARLPGEWKTSDGKWFTLELKDEDAVNTALEEQFADFMADEKKQAAGVTAQARKISVFLSILFFLIGILGCAAAFYLFIRFRASGR
jgi:N-acetylglutamate synthase-like GNAT family acetyltransferase